MPEEMLLDVVLSGEKPLWPDVNAPNDFRPVKGRFARTKLLIAEVQSQASRHIELGAAIEL